jgi:predicted small metal-binding protein
MTGYSADLKQVCGCSWAATGANADEVTKKVVSHAKQAHGLNEVPAEIAHKLQESMRPVM